jgi:hypothetical protein
MRHGGGEEGSGMKRRIVHILLLLIGGAIANIAVAWGMLLNGPLTDFSAPRDVDRWRVFAQRHGLEQSQPLMHDYQFTGFGFAVNKVDYVPTVLGGMEIFGSGTFIVRTECGWPTRSLHGWAYEHQDYCHCIRMDHRRRIYGSDDGCLPLRPLWPGFGINILFYALLLWLVFCAPFVARRVLRRKRRVCEKCAYPIGASPVCTECGAAVSTRRSAADRLQS